MTGNKSSEFSQQDPNQESVLDSTSLGLIAENLQPSNPSEVQKSSIKQKLMQKIRHPEVVQSGSDEVKTIRADDGEWHEVAPKVTMKVLRRDLESNSQTALWRLEPGALIPHHPHPVEEECLVLQGEIQFGNHRLSKGDYEVISAGTEHGEMTSVHGALIMLRSDIPHDLSWIG